MQLEPLTQLLRLPKPRQVIGPRLLGAPQKF